MTHTVTQIQAKLSDLNYLSALAPDGTSNIDGKFGQRTLEGYNHFRASIGKGPVVQGVPAEIEADLWPAEQPAPPPPTRSVLSNLGTLLSILQLLKGKTMTSDQITGIIRLLLGLVGGYFVSKGLVTQSLFDWISAGVLTAIPGVWSWISNRPKTIVPIASK